MKKLQCECCGGSINPKTYKCEYCGTQYKKDEYESIIKIETFTNPVQIYKSSMEIPNSQICAMGEREASNFAIKALAANLADTIAKNMEIVVEPNPILLTQKISARVRIVESNYRF